MEPARPVTRERAARFGTYPVAATASETTRWISGSTLRILLITRETVARETPATRATSCNVGRRSEVRAWSLPMARL